MERKHILPGTVTSMYARRGRRHSSVNEPFCTVDIEDPSVLLGYSQETVQYDEMSEEVGRSVKMLQKRCVGPCSSSLTEVTVFSPAEFD